MGISGFFVLSTRLVVPPDNCLAFGCFLQVCVSRWDLLSLVGGCFALWLAILFSPKSYRTELMLLVPCKFKICWKITVSYRRGTWAHFCVCPTQRCLLPLTPPLVSLLGPGAAAPRGGTWMGHPILSPHNVGPSLAVCICSSVLGEMGLGWADGSWDGAGCCLGKAAVIAVGLESQDPRHPLSQGGLRCLQGRRSPLLKESPEIFLFSQIF